MIPIRSVKLTLAEFVRLTLAWTHFLVAPGHVAPNDTVIGSAGSGAVTAAERNVS